MSSLPPSTIVVVNQDQDDVERDKGGSSARLATDRFVGMFSYGSNNERQLGARVKNPRLRGSPAYLDGYMRIFGSSSPVWTSGSVASIAPKKGGRVYGCFYLMTPQEVETLDVYERVKEGGYFKEAVMVEVRVSRQDAEGVCSTEEGGGEISEGGGRRGEVLGGEQHRCGYVSTPAITYIMSQRYVDKFVQPSAAYLTSVYRILTENFPELSGEPIEVCDFTGRKRSEWTYPGCRNLPLEAFLLEIGLREDPPWAFPLALKPQVARLAAAGITTTDALCDAAVSGVLLSNLEAARTNAVEGPDALTVAEVTEKYLDGIAAGQAVATTPSEGMSNPLYEAESVRRWAATVALPEFTDQTMAIVSRIASVSDWQ